MISHHCIEVSNILYECSFFLCIFQLILSIFLFSILIQTFYFYSTEIEILTEDTFMIGIETDTLIGKEIDVTGGTGIEKGKEIEIELYMILQKAQMMMKIMVQ